MILFFNDTFLEKEYVNVSEEKFHISCESILAIFDEIRNKRQQFSSQSIIVKCSKSAIEALFSAINKKDLEVLFLKSLANVNIKYWDQRSSVQDDNYNYFFYNSIITPPASENINKSSLAEAAELIKRGENLVLAINLPDLIFSNYYQLSVNINSILDHQDVALVCVNCTDSCDGLIFWIDSHLDEKLKYKDFSRVPLDEESCLINKQKFAKLNGLKSQGRQVYQDISKRYWYIDNAHKGGGAHIEVFDKNGDHIGESDLRGKIDVSKKVPGRSFEKD